MRTACLLILLGAAYGLAADAPAPSTSPATVRGVLAEWERSSAFRQTVDLDQYRDRYGTQYAEPALHLGTAFFGPVDAESLQKSFRWSIVDASEAEIRLRATPRRINPPQDATLAISSQSPLNNGDGFTPNEGLPLGVLDGASAIEIVLDRRFFGARLVRWIGGPNPTREGIERLAADDFPLVEAELEARRMVSPGRGDVVQATAMMLQGEAQGRTESDPRLLEVLTRWEQAVDEFRAVDLKFKRYDYDNIFELETRGQGRFVFVSPDKGLYELKPATVVERADGRTKVGGGNFSVAPAKPQLLCWNGETVTIVDVREKIFDEMAIPRRLRGDVQAVGSWDVIWQVLAGPQKALPGVVDLRSEQFSSRLQWSIVKDEENEIMIEGRPRLAADRRHMSRLDIILDPRQFRTMATRVVDPSGSHETVHTFEYVLVNDEQLQQSSSWRPDLTKFSPVGPPPMAPPAEDLPPVPPTQE